MAQSLYTEQAWSSEPAAALKSWDQHKVDAPSCNLARQAETDLGAEAKWRERALVKLEREGRRLRKEEERRDEARRKEMRRIKRDAERKAWRSGLSVSVSLFISFSPFHLLLVCSACRCSMLTCVFAVCAGEGLSAMSITFSRFHA